MLVNIDTLKTILSALKVSTSQAIQDALKDEISIEPSGSDIPVVTLTGTIPTDKTQVYCELDYVSTTRTFHAYAKIKCQGNSSMVYPKKNFSIELFADEGCSIPLNQTFKNWGAHNDYVLKANYIDHLHARNIVCANLWADIVRSRPDFDSLPEELKNSPNMGAIDGFPIKVYANGNYEGIYTWNIPKCAWQFGLDESNTQHALLSAEFNDNGLTENQYNPCNFNQPWGANEEYWSVEVGELSHEVVDSIDYGIIIPITNENISNLSTHLDIQSAIDYFIFQDVIGGIDGLAKNMLLVTYDVNKWYLSAYDMDSTFDLWWEGGMMDNPTLYMPDDYLNQYSALLFLIWDYYWEDMVARYAELRKTVLSVSSIMSKFEQFLTVADEDVRIEDTIAYPDIPAVTENTLSHLRDFVQQRLAFLDADYGVEV